MGKKRPRVDLRRLAGAAAILGGLAAFTPASSSAQPGWNEPIDLSPGYLYTYAQLAPDGGGGFVHTWDEMTSDRWPIYARSIPATGPAGPTQTLDGRTFFGADIAGDGHGTVLAAWQETSEDCCTTLSASVKELGQPFGPTIDVPYGGGWVGQMKVAMNENGEGVIVYGVGDSGDAQLRAVFRSPTGVLSPPHRVTSKSEEYIWDFELDLSSAGEAIVAWSSERSTGKHAVRTNTGTASGFGDPVTLSDPSEYAFPSGAAIDAAGGAIVEFAYDYNEATPPVPVMAAVREPGSTFGQAFKIGDAIQGGAMDAGVADDGRALVSFVDDFEMVVRPVSTRTSTLGPRTTIPITAGWGKLTVGDDGRALVGLDSVFVIGPGSFYSSPVWAIWGDASGHFEVPQALNCTAHSYRLQHDLTIGSEGNAAVMLLNHNDDLPNDTDDRTLIARANATVAPRFGCGTDADGVVKPTPKPAPRVSVVLKKAIVVGRGGTFAATTLVSDAGELRLRGSVRVGPHKSHVHATERIGGPGVVRSKLRLKPALTRRLLDGERARLKLVGTLEAEGGRVRDTQRAILQAPPKLVED